MRQRRRHWPRFQRVASQGDPPVPPPGLGVVHLLAPVDLHGQRTAVVRILDIAVVHQHHPAVARAARIGLEQAVGTVWDPAAHRLALHPGDEVAGLGLEGLRQHRPGLERRQARTALETGGELVAREAARRGRQVDEGDGSVLRAQLRPRPQPHDPRLLRRGLRLRRRHLGLGFGSRGQ